MKVIGIRYNFSTDTCGDASAMPTVFLMSDSSLLKDGKPFFVPDFAERFVCSASIVFRVNRLGKNIAKRFANRYYDAVTIGMTVKAEGMKEAFADGDAGALTEAFDGAAILGDFVPMENVMMPVTFEVKADDNTITNGSSAMMTIDIDGIIEYVSRYFTLKIGDIIFATCPEPCHTLNLDSTIEATMAGNRVLHFKVK